MTWPHDIDCTINDGENKTETSAKLLRAVEAYGKFGPMAEYESAGGMRFWIEAEYMQTCQDTHQIPDIPIEVITKNAEIRNKLEYGNSLLVKQAVEETTGIILPPGYEIPKV